MYKTKKNLLLLIILLFTGIAYAYDEPRYSNSFLLSVYFKAVVLRDKALTEIRNIDVEILKNEKTIQNSERIITLARQKGNTRAEMVAKDALMKAAEAKRKNEATKKQWELSKIRADRSYATIINMFSQNFDSNRQIKGFLTNYTGNVYIIKANGEKASPENGFLEPGDKVWTGDGSAEIQMLDGRATTKIGSYSEFAMKKETPQEQIVELFKGKIYMAVDKIDDYAKKMKENIDQYKDDLQTIKHLKKEDIDALKNFIERRLLILEWCRTVHSGCPTAVCAVRSTKFTSDIKEDNSMEITVLDGVVDINIPELGKSISLREGNRGIITRDGTIIQEKAEPSARWWER